MVKSVENNKDLILLDIIGDFSECPNCGISFTGEDIYQFFLNKYTNDWPYKYAITKEKMLNDKKNYPEQYIEFPDSLDHLNDIEANALYTARLYGWTEKNPKTFMDHIIGIEIQGQYDGVLFWYCDQCNVYWKRFKWSNFKYLLGEENV